MYVFMYIGFTLRMYVQLVEMRKIIPWQKNNVKNISILLYLDELMRKILQHKLIRFKGI